jgi:aryl sulfotransferase
VTEKPLRYRSNDEDSHRWEGFAFRRGDIVISTRSKSGTTWMQMICALLVFQRPDLPAPLARISPWLDWRIAPREQVFAELEAQPHRRVIKTHTPLDGIPLDPMATYIVVGRHPLDMAVSLYHQGSNIDRKRARELTGHSEPDRVSPPRPALREWLLSWIDADVPPRERLDSLPGVLMHVSDAWARRTACLSGDPASSGSAAPAGSRPGVPVVLLTHYHDLSADLAGQMRRLAALLGIAVAEERWPDLVRAASFDSMRAQAAQRVPDPAGVLKDPVAFFRRGRSGADMHYLTSDEVEHYYARVARLAEPDVLTWLHGSASSRAAAGRDDVPVGAIPPGGFSLSAGGYTAYTRLAPDYRLRGLVRLSRPWQASRQVDLPRTGTP